MAGILWARRQLRSPWPFGGAQACEINDSIIGELLRKPPVFVLSVKYEVQGRSSSRQPMSLTFEWDASKARSNKNKHGITFNEASTVFDDDLAVIFEDVQHSDQELRAVIIGHSVMNRLLIVSFTERLNTVRIISARKATARERRDYEAHIKAD